MNTPPVKPAGYVICHGGQFVRSFAITQSHVTVRHSPTLIGSWMFDDEKRASAAAGLLPGRYQVSPVSHEQIEAAAAEAAANKGKRRRR